MMCWEINERKGLFWSVRHWSLDFGDKLQGGKVKDLAFLELGQKVSQNMLTKHYLGYILVCCSKHHNERLLWEERGKCSLKSHFQVNSLSLRKVGAGTWSRNRRRIMRMLAPQAYVQLAWLHLPGPPPKNDVILEMLGIRQWWDAYLSHSPAEQLSCITCFLGCCTHTASADVFSQTFAFRQPSVRSDTHIDLEL